MPTLRLEKLLPSPTPNESVRMFSEATIGLAFLALIFEAACGYPGLLLRVIGHPVMWMGALIGLIDRYLNDEKDDHSSRRQAGMIGLMLLLATVGIVAYGIESTLLALPFVGGVAAALVASSLLAQRSLYEHVVRVAAGLEKDLASGRAAVSQIVGRDPEALDEAGVARAAIESLAENFSDGIVAPAIWMAAGGLTGGALYKAVNTADSMIGHRTPRHEAFGWAAAKLDDLVNLPASRLAGVLVAVAALFLPGASARGAWRAMLRDAPSHRSPNAGWPEAAVAGALGLALAGPRAYGGKVVVDGYMGAGGRREANAADIRRALRLYRLADGLLIGLVGILAVLAMLSH